MRLTLHARTARIALALLAAVCAGALAGCNQPPALSKAELDAAKMPKKHPEIDPKLAKDCRKCHREQPPIKK
jgi:hypothetical protein